MTSKKQEIKRIKKIQKNRQKEREPMENIKKKKFFNLVGARWN